MSAPVQKGWSVQCRAGAKRTAAIGGRRASGIVQESPHLRGPGLLGRLSPALRAQARSWLSVVLLIWGDARGALAESERAMVLSPNLAFAHAAYGCVLAWSRRPRECLA